MKALRSFETSATAKHHRRLEFKAIDVSSRRRRWQTSSGENRENRFRCNSCKHWHPFTKHKQWFMLRSQLIIVRLPLTSLTATAWVRRNWRQFHSLLFQFALPGQTFWNVAKISWTRRVNVTALITILRKRKFVYISHKDSVCALQRTQCPSITNGQLLKVV